MVIYNTIALARYRAWNSVALPPDWWVWARTWLDLGTLRSAYGIEFL
jgi:hypothetical protein